MADPKSLPSILNCSETNPSESATATIVTFPETLDPLPGEASDRLGSMPTAETATGEVTIQPTAAPRKRPIRLRAPELPNFMPMHRARDMPGD
jgi:hypothetical protein